MTLVAEPRLDLDDTLPHQEHPQVLMAAAHSSRLSVVGPQERVLHPKPSGRPDPTAHLSAADLEALGRELDALRQSVLDTRGARDAAYIRKTIAAQRYIELGSRAVLLFSIFPPAWLLGTAGLTLSKILDNMEIGHNVLHGQWDWMRDPQIHSTTWEWDFVSPAAQWQDTHNVTHHTYTNVLEKDSDLGYGLFRVDPDQPWTLGSLAQPFWSLLNALFFEWGIASYDLQLHSILNGEMPKDEAKRRWEALRSKIIKKLGKEYVLWPLLSGPSAFTTMAANATSSILRNLWANGVILCGHFPYGVDTFAPDSIDNETRGQWYVRQMLGSGNISGPWIVHFLSGNLSHQIEHHLFPDLPSNRYYEIAPQVRDICRRYGLHYVTGSYPKQVASAWAKIIVLSLPNKEEGRSRASIVAEAAGEAVSAKVAKFRARRAAKRAR
ncbi:MAG: acyl-CoA desaturase [Dermatophilaceae bacterium]